MTDHIATRHRHSLTTGFFRPMLAGILLVNLLVCGATILSLYQMRIQEEQRAVAASRNQAQLLDEYVAAAVDKVDLALQTVADEAMDQRAGGGIDAGRMNAVIARQFERQADLESLRMTDAQGLVLYGTRVDPAQKVSFAGTEFFSRLRNDPNVGLVVSRPLTGPISGKRVVILARRIAGQNGAFDGMVYAPITLEHFHAMFAALDIGRRGTIVLRDADTGVIARFPEFKEAEGGKMPDEYDGRMLAGAGVGTYPARAEPDGIERIYSYRRIAHQPLLVSVGVAMDDFLDPWRSKVVERAAYLAIFALATLFWAWLFYRFWVRRTLAEQLEAQVTERTAQLRDLAIELTMVEEHGRQEISQELHDDLGQMLAIARLKLSTLAADAANEGFQRQIHEIEAMIDHANRAVRSLSMQLSPPVLHQFGLIAALEWLAEQMRENYGMNVGVHDDGQSKPLGPVASGMLFRAVRELLINVHKHAGYNAADVSASVQDGRLVVSVSDDGAGFDLQKLERQPTTRGGYGLFSLKERMRYFGGEMQIDSRPGDGTVVVLIVPLEGDEKGAAT